jgi:hypothetical protein
MKWLGLTLIFVSACSSSGGGRTVLALGDGGITLLPNETCARPTLCGGDKNYRQCTLTSGGACQARLVTSDAQSFYCAACNDCTAATVQVNNWCTPPPDMALPAADTKCVAARDCITCCGDNHPAGSSMLADAVDNCVCSDPGACVDSCVNYCLFGSLGQRCSDCINQATATGGACDLNAQCAGDADCMAYVTCTNTCP